MLQNSLDRLLAALAVSLTDEIAPQLEDPYARAQAMAAAELVNNLSTRVEWRRDLLIEEIEAVYVALDERPEGPVDELSADALNDRYEDLLGRLAERAAAGGAEIEAYVDGSLERESSRLRTGMYRKSGS